MLLRQCGAEPYGGAAQWPDVHLPKKPELHVALAYCCLNVVRCDWSDQNLDYGFCRFLGQL